MMNDEQSQDTMKQYSRYLDEDIAGQVSKNETVTWESVLMIRGQAFSEE
jgi:hypothetical protein